MGQGPKMWINMCKGVIFASEQTWKFVSEQTWEKSKTSTALKIVTTVCSISNQQYIEFKNWVFSSVGEKGMRAINILPRSSSIFAKNRLSCI